MSTYGPHHSQIGCLLQDHLSRDNISIYFYMYGTGRKAYSTFFGRHLSNLTLPLTISEIMIIFNLNNIL